MFTREKSSTVPLRSALVAAVVLVALAFCVGFFTAGRMAYGQGGSLLGPGAPEGIDMAPVWKAWRVIDEKFVPAAVSTSTPVATSTAKINEERVWGMIGGLAASLDDPYTYFLPPQENQMFADDMSGAFEGVGMEIAVRDEILTIVSPLKGTPAERAGLKSGDKVLQIDKFDTKGMDIGTAVKKIRGPRGTEVALLVMREGWSAPKEIRVVRDVINVPIVTTTKRDDGIFVIQVSTFTSNSPELFRAALREFVETKGNRLVLDLRGNPGGYLDAAVGMASWFLPQGAVVVEEDYAGHSKNVVHRSSGYNIFDQNLKMIILVDKGSASASEILADALRHYNRATLVGVNTFGKGSVQELVDITSNTALKITVARWLGPDKKQIPNTGIAPDVKVEITEEQAKDNVDPQMEEAIKILGGNAKI